MPSVEKTAMDRLKAKLKSRWQRKSDTNAHLTRDNAVLKAPNGTVNDVDEAEKHASKPAGKLITQGILRS